MGLRDLVWRFGPIVAGVVLVAAGFERVASWALGGPPFSWWRAAGLMAVLGAVVWWGWPLWRRARDGRFGR